MKYEKSTKNVDVNLSDMKPNPKNPREKYDKRELEELKLSFEAMGQLTNCILDENGYILAGHRRHFAAKELGWDKLKCDIKVGLSPFQCSAIMISSNSTQVHFNSWENREAISRIYWDEFLEEYIPRGDRDKGYTAFASKLGLSGTYVKKIIEASRGENKQIYNELKSAKVDEDTANVVLTAPKELRGYLSDVAIRRTKKVSGMETHARTRDYVRAAKRKAILEDEGFISKRHFRKWISDIETIGFQLGDYIIKGGDDKELQKLEIAIRKHILGFYSKLKKNLDG